MAANISIKRLVFIGPQGSGKGTQAEVLAKEYQLPVISTGDIFRKNISEKTDLGKQAEAIIESGKLVPDDITNSMVADRLRQPDAAEGFILDGYPRNLNQAEYLENNLPPEIVVEIKLNDEEAIKRISSRLVCPTCGKTYNMLVKQPKQKDSCDKCQGKLERRDDDQPEAVKERLKIYRQDTAPILDYYKANNKLVSIDGQPPIAEVTTLMKKAISDWTAN
ncbi:MAG: adenylate kinase [Patescibacteria group bacterium]